MKNSKTRILSLVFFIVCGVLFGQQTRVELGNKYFDQFAYKKAILLYSEAIERGYSEWSIFAKLGDCYYYTSQPEKAIENYKIAISKRINIRPIYRLRYALSLKSAGLETESLEEFGKYHKDIEQLGMRAIIDSIDTSENLSINSEFSDFGSFIFKDTLYFASTRENPSKKRRFNKRLYKWNEQPYLDIYSAALINDDSIAFKLVHPDSSRINVNSIAHEASVTISSDGKTMYFAGGITNKNKLVYNNRGVANLKLYRATLVNNRWIVTEKDKEAMKHFGFDNYSVGNPALSPDNKRLFFVTCAPLPDAKGHTDIYYVDINEDGSYGPITNVPGVNTSGRESFPFVSEDGSLYFSSDGIHDEKVSYGLLDIFKVKDIGQVIEKYKKEKHSRDRVVLNISHLESPFNSERDDFAFFLEPSTSDNPNEVYAYFSSNRDHPNAKGDDDIYRAKMYLPKSIKVVVTDSLTSEYLVNASVELINSSGKIVDSAKIGSGGSVNFTIEVGETYRVRGSMPRYYDDLESFNYFDHEESVLLELSPYPCEISINHIEFDLDSDMIRPDVIDAFKPVLELLMSNRDLKIRIESHTDSHGEPEYNLGLSERRAYKTRLYLLQNGANPDQIISAKGFGEKCLLISDEVINSLPLNERETKHELNRRSTFIIDGCDDTHISCEGNNSD